MKQKKLIFNFFVNRNWKKLTDSRKKAKILADNRKSHYPIETLQKEQEGRKTLKFSLFNFSPTPYYLTARNRLGKKLTRETAKQHFFWKTELFSQ